MFKQRLITIIIVLLSIQIANGKELKEKYKDWKTNNHNSNRKTKRATAKSKIRKSKKQKIAGVMELHLSLSVQGF